MNTKLILVPSSEVQAPAQVSVQAEAPVPPKRGNVLTDEQRRKGGIASAAKRRAAAEARKASQANVQAPKLEGGSIPLQTAEAPQDPMRWYRNEVHATWNYYTTCPESKAYEFAHADTDTSGFAVALGLKLAGLKLIQAEGFAYVLCLRHRASGCFVLCFATNTRLTFASTFADKSKVPAEVKADLASLFDQVSRKGA